MGAIFTLVRRSGFTAVAVVCALTSSLHAQVNRSELLLTRATAYVREFVDYSKSMARRFTIGTNG